jgi:methylthioribose-1-phosphate isomerase
MREHIDPAVTGPPPVRWDGRRLSVLDQTRLPAEERVLTLWGAEDTAEAIRRLVVRGAPLIGVTAAYGLVMGVAEDPTPEGLERSAAVLRGARPTAANLAWAVDRVAAAAGAAASGPAMAAAARAQAEEIETENAAAGAALSERGADLLAGVERVLTHCNTGALACGTRGSALGVIMAMVERNPRVHVLVCETRPLLQGARLTTWELARAGISHELIVDAAAAGLIRAGDVGAVVVGFDRMAANGDAANKVGTYSHALATNAAGIPFVLAGPISSIDATLGSGEEIVIEERDPDEVRLAGGALVTVPGTPVRNPAFDVTPAELVTAVVTERGQARPPNRATIAALLGRA